MLYNSLFLQIFAILFIFGQFFNFADSLPTPTTMPSPIVSLLNSSQTVLDLTDNYSVAAFWDAKNCSNQTEDDPRARSYFWSIHDPTLNGTNGDGKLVGYLFGTIKVPANLIWNSIFPEILAKMQTADSLILETDESEGVGFIRKCYQLLQNDPPLSDGMAKRLEKYLAKHEAEDLPEWRLFRLKNLKEIPPQWMLTGLLIVQAHKEMRELNGELRQMMDQKLANLSMEHGTSIGYLEKFNAKGDSDANELCQLFPSLRDRKNLMEFAIGHLIDELERKEAAENVTSVGQFWVGPVKQIIGNYKCGILQRNDELLATNTQNTTEMNLIEQVNSLMAEDLFQSRNRRMAPIIQQQLRQNPQKLQFFAIGAGNLIGIGNLVQLLENDGFKLHEEFLPPSNVFPLPNDNEEEAIMAKARGSMPQEFGRIGDRNLSYLVILILAILFVFGCIIAIFSTFFYRRSRSKLGEHSLASGETGKPDLMSVKSNSPPPTISVITNNKLLASNSPHQQNKQQQEDGNKDQPQMEMQQRTSPYQFQRNLNVKNKSPAGYTQSLTVQQSSSTTISHQNLAYIDSTAPSPASSQQNVQCATSEQKIVTGQQPQQKVIDSNEIGGGKDDRVSNIYATYTTYTPKYGRKETPAPIHPFGNQTQMAKSTFLHSEQPKMMGENAWNTNSGTFSPLAIGRVPSEPNAPPALAKPQQEYELYRGETDQKQQSAAEGEESGMEEPSQLAAENDQKKPTVHILQVGIDFEPILECAEEQKEQQIEATNTFGDNELEEKKKMDESEELANETGKNAADFAAKTTTTVLVECHQQNEGVIPDEATKDESSQIPQSSKTENAATEDEDDGSVVV